jgi:hypothetical protein
MDTVPKPRTAAAPAARRSRTDTALLRVRESIARLQREKAEVSIAAVARRANVSRTFLYANNEPPIAEGAAARPCGHSCHGNAPHAPATPSMLSRIRSAWPL